MADPQTTHEENLEFNERIPEAFKPLNCADHKLDFTFVKKEELVLICPVCMMNYGLNSAELILYPEFIRDKREDLKIIFVKNKKYLSSL